jgi:ADP-ribosylglycohydrolase
VSRPWNQALGIVRPDDWIRNYKPENGTGYILDCLHCARESVESASTYEEAVINAIKWGEDTDTTAAVAGGIAGIRWGVPKVCVQALRGQDILRNLDLL